MGLLGAVRTILVFPAVAFLVGTLTLVTVGCFVVESVWKLSAVVFGSLVITEILIAVAAGARWIEDVIGVRHDDPGGGGPDPLKQVGHQVVMMMEILLFVSCFSLIVWIPAEISRIRNIGLAWPVCWAILGGAAFWVRRMVLNWIDCRSPIPDTDPCSTPGIPPSGEP